MDTAGTLTRSCPNWRGLKDPSVDFGGLPASRNSSERLETSVATPVCRLGEIALITRRSQVQILPPQLKNRRPYRHLACRANTFPGSGNDPKVVGLQAVSNGQKRLRSFRQLSSAQRARGLVPTDHGLARVLLLLGRLTQYTCTRKLCV